MPLNEQRDEIADWAPVKSSAEGRGRATGTVLAMVAHLRAPYELMWFPISHSDSPEEVVDGVREALSRPDLVRLARSLPA